MRKDLTKRLATRLAQLRRARGLTLDQLAADSGVSRAALSRLENAEVSPSAEVLARLASAHGMSLSRLAALVEDGFAPVVSRDDQPQIKGEGKSVTRRFVSPGAAGLAGELSEMRFPPETTWIEPKPDVPGQERHILVLNGALKAAMPGQEHQLSAGDCLRLRCDGALSMTTAPGQGAKILMVCIAP